MLIDAEVGDRSGDPAADRAYGSVEPDPERAVERADESADSDPPAAVVE